MQRPRLGTLRFFLRLMQLGVSIGRMENTSVLRSCTRVHLFGRETILGPSHISTLQSVHNIGVLCQDQGDLKSAEEMFQRALEGHEMASNEDDGSPPMETLDTLQSLANLYRIQNQLEKVEHMCQRALSGYKKALTADHPSTLNAIHNLGNIYWAQHQLDAA
ncbi:uncharacterized protein BO97DRAFT_419732 [Aspergillus homomorphus CBS 101889]|uniref:TPR-like protein n=1 Tax=Aspergillus homomorphus (strain CBS 101889) TaxID=1450537 RepID=A0A395IH04_ASPHC|nr:hypothetical protein BO97DRAFT_419732 [Aspergillus homomorphus CBS 101889]RAL17494.1 hypothetical protein BO97DRAFT_419732 [Aspergillus homomorphus CBS 101889]